MACTILVADPDQKDREHTIEVLREVATELQLDPKFHEAKNGREALNLVEEHEPTLVVTEALLPEMSGFDLLRRIHSDSSGSPPPVMVVSYMTAEHDRYWALRQGAHSYVMKPFDDSVLADRARRLLREGASARPEKPGLD